jgi:3-hydroxyacyl-CoA dehydrogenase
MTAARQVIALQDAFWQEGEALMFRHTTPWELDEALEAWGYGIGPCAAQDLMGLDKVLARQPNRAAPILPRMVAEGRIGKLGGVGYFRYPGGGGAVIDPLIEDMFREEAWFAKVVRSPLGDGAVITAMHEALAQVLLEIGVDRHAADGLLQDAVQFPAGRALI